MSHAPSTKRGLHQIGATPHGSINGGKCVCVCV